MKGQKLLKVTSILMIIGGVIAAIVGVLALLGISALVALAERDARWEFSLSTGRQTCHG